MEMESSLVRIGNSKGVIIPKKMLDRLGITNKFDISEHDGTIVIVPVEEHKPREDWEEHFSRQIQKISSDTDNGLESLSNDFDQTEWTW